MVTVLVCGSRDYSNRVEIAGAMQEVFNRFGGFVQVVHGDCSGADAIAANEAKAMGFRVVPVPAQWSKYGRAAGPKRNEMMLRQFGPELVLAFSSKPYLTRGTADMVRRARAAGVEVVEHISDQHPEGEKP